jgi:hypothetical protein
VWFAWNAKEVVRQIYDHTDAELAEAEWVAEIVRDFTDAEMPFEVRRLGRTIARWAATRSSRGTARTSPTARPKR